MNNKKQSKKGITLISLVITIIILLILAGVAISIAVDSDGLFSKSRQATNGWNTAVAQEEASVNEMLEQLKGITAKKVSANLPEFFGKEVINYTCDNSEAVHAWKIFYADDENIYLIADECIDSSYIPKGKNGSSVTIIGTNQCGFDDVINDYTGALDIQNSKAKKWLSFLEINPTSEENNVKATAYLMDDTVWGSFAGEYAEYAIGGPTLEFYLAAYKEIYNKENEIYQVTSSGYEIIDGNLQWIEEDTGKFWIAGPSTGVFYFTWGDTCQSVLTSTRNGDLSYYSIRRDTGCGYTYSPAKIRPVICLKNSVELESIDGAYQIK